ncbi:MAG: orotate phosphoribosyltransferase [Agarilytica sp.]
MEDYQSEFIQLAIDVEALSFGQFTLKSGRTSPYFFNAGKFQTGASVAKLGRFYAKALMASDVKFDMLFGPAYKGIPLAAVTVASLAENHQRDVPFCYNRKEAKDHGEGGSLVGAPLVGRVAIIDDVITAGTAVREVLSIIEAQGAKPAAIVVGLNRQEKGQGERSAIEELEQETGIPVISIVNLAHIMHFLEESGDEKTLEDVRLYRQQYGT